jgi:hypothetical protein
MLEIVAVELPSSMHFLQPGWWVFHLVVIPLIFVLGLAAGRRGALAGDMGTARGSP